jgi:hypothetical protein
MAMPKTVYSRTTFAPLTYGSSVSPSRPSTRPRRSGASHALAPRCPQSEPLQMQGLARSPPSYEALPTICGSEPRIAPIAASVAAIVSTAARRRGLVSPCTVHAGGRDCESERNSPRTEAIHMRHRIAPDTSGHRARTPEARVARRTGGSPGGSGIVRARLRSRPTGARTRSHQQPYPRTHQAPPSSRLASAAISSRPAASRASPELDQPPNRLSEPQIEAFVDAVGPQLVRDSNCR